MNYVGQIRYETASEPFIFPFTSIHSSPTGWQSLYIYPNETRPVGFTVPHSGAVPTNASTDVALLEDGQFGNAADRSAKWVICPTGQSGIAQLYWEGGEKNTSCDAVKLTPEY
ncbi:hypothetical protein YB2330_004254 [Saitoella coloradoensis]